MPAAGFEPARTVKSTNMTGWRVYQFHHTGTGRFVTLARRLLVSKLRTRNGNATLLVHPRCCTCNVSDVIGVPIRNLTRFMVTYEHSCVSVSIRERPLITVKCIHAVSISALSICEVQFPNARACKCSRQLEAALIIPSGGIEPPLENPWCAFRL